MGLEGKRDLNVSYICIFLRVIVSISNWMFVRMAGIVGNSRKEGFGLLEHRHNKQVAISVYIVHFGISHNCIAP